MKKGRQARIRDIRRRNTKIVLGYGSKYAVKLKIDHQSFRVGDGLIESKRSAQWLSKMLAIALNRFKNGD